LTVGISTKGGLLVVVVVVVVVVVDVVVVVVDATGSSCQFLPSSLYR
jgi:hypothetical protein